MWDYVDAKNEIYIPAALIIVGVGITKAEWLPYAILLAAGLVYLKLYQYRKSAYPNGADAVGPRKVLKPDVLQEFELQSKTIVSHNTAM